MPTYEQLLARWRKPGAQGFLAWIADTKPQVPSAAGGYCTLRLGKWEKQELRRALAARHSTVVFSWPRRHGKSVVAAAIIVHRFVTRQTQSVAIVSNSREQSIDVTFKLVRTIGGLLIAWASPREVWK